VITEIFIYISTKGYHISFLLSYVSNSFNKEFS